MSDVSGEIGDLRQRIEVVVDEHVAPWNIDPDMPIDRAGLVDEIVACLGLRRWTIPDDIYDDLSTDQQHKTWAWPDLYAMGIAAGPRMVLADEARR